MIIDMRIIPDGHSVLDQECMLESVKENLPSFSEAVRCHAEIDRVGETFVVGLQFEGHFQLQCSRCLESFSVPVSSDLRVIVKEVAGKHGLSLDDDDEVDFYYDSRHDIVDISQAIYDEIMIALPLMPLCNQDCRGIELSDPDINLSTDESEAVEAVEKPIDPRWEALKKLKK